MIGGLVRRWLCRHGRHDVLRCAGAEDHAWTHDGQRWTATLDRVSPIRPAAPAPRAVRSADLLCRCGSRQDEHRPAAEGGCTVCPCLGFALSPREELDLYRANQRVSAVSPPAGKNDLGRHRS